MHALILATILGATSPGAPDQQELIGTLRSDAQPAEKAIACKRLAIYGNGDAVPALAPLLANEQLASWARIALESIPDPVAGVALREAVGKLDGKLLVGAINSIGFRRDAESSAVLASRLGDADAEVAAAAAVALGRIGGQAVAARLTPLLGNLRPAAAEGCILCAERMLADGQKAEAVKLYDAVRAANVSRQKNLEAMRGSILARDDAGIPLLIEQLRSEERASFNMALRTAREMPGSEVAQALMAEMERAPIDRRAHLLLTLADRGGAEVLPAAIGAARAGSPDLRLTAVKILEKLGDPTCVPVLVAILSEDDPELSEAAKSSLIRMPGGSVDEAVIDLLKRSGVAARRAAIEVVAARRLPGAMPVLLKAATDADTAISAASLKALGELAGEAEIPAMIDLLGKASRPDAVENALSSICSRLSRPTGGAITIQKAVYGDLPDGRSADVTEKVVAIVKGGASSVDASNRLFGDPAPGRVKKLRVEYIINGQPATRTVAENDAARLSVNAAPPGVIDPLCAALVESSGGPKAALLRVLRSAGGPKALAAIRTAANETDTSVREAALRALCDWESADALPDLVQLTRSAPEKKWKILALRGQLRLIPQQEAGADQKLAGIREAMGAIERTEEKRLALAALGEIPTAESLGLVAPFLSVDELKEEAGVAAVTISERIVDKHPEAVAQAMANVTTTNKKLAGRVRQLQARAKKK